MPYGGPYNPPVTPTGPPPRTFDQLLSDLNVGPAGIASFTLHEIMSNPERFLSPQTATVVEGSDNAVVLPEAGP